jgi:hypothetical protein
VSSPVRHALAAISVVRIGFGTNVSFPGSGMGRIIANVYALKTSVSLLDAAVALCIISTSPADESCMIPNRYGRAVQSAGFDGDER